MATKHWVAVLHIMHTIKNITYTNQLEYCSLIVADYGNYIDSHFLHDKTIGSDVWIENQTVLGYDYPPPHTSSVKHTNSEGEEQYVGTDYEIQYKHLHPSLLHSSLKNGEPLLPNSISITYQFITKIKSNKDTDNTNDSKYRTDHASAVPKDNPFGLHSRKWDLPRQASDYYLLHLLNIMSPKQEGVAKTLQKLTDKLDDQFRRYTDMVIGGELRHFDTDKYSNHKLVDSIPAMADILEDNSLMSVSTSRSKAWIGWYYVRQEYGTLALRWAEKMFRTGVWMTGYGGEMWANITKVLIQRELDETTPNTFVDSCWGLHHNNGSYFNKWWATSKDIQPILNSNLDGYYCDNYPDHPLHRCSSFTRYLVEENPKLINEVCQCGLHNRQREKEREDIRKRTYFVQQIINQIHNYTEGEKDNAK